MSISDEEITRDDPDFRTLLEEDGDSRSSVTRYVGEGRIVGGGMMGVEEEKRSSTRNNIVKNVGKIFNFGAALTSRKKGGATITKRGTSFRKKKKNNNIPAG